jgi:hypothetical protein
MTVRLGVLAIIFLETVASLFLLTSPNEPPRKKITTPSLYSDFSSGLAGASDLFFHPAC